jgi:4-phosphopantoate--beta-alanine ligase
MVRLSKSHPRYESLKTRDLLVKSVEDGITHKTGLIAHGRGEAFDYIIGEKTINIANKSESIAAAALLLAKNPVISVNGNVAALNPKDCVSLSNAIPAKLEINLFHRSNDRVNKIYDVLVRNGADKVYGLSPNANISFINHNRSFCDKNGIFSSDVVLVPLEDGDRCNALKKMGKKVITIDLNPLSRTSRDADITIVDNVVRAIPNIERWVKKYSDIKKDILFKKVENWNNEEMLKNILNYISKRLNSMF